MKFFSALLLVCAFAFASPAHALVDSAKGVVYQDSQGTITTTAFTTMVASLTKAVKGITITNTSTSDLQLGIGASSSEQVQLVIPGNGASAVPVFYPIALSQGLRISLRALDSSASVGKQVINFFYY